MKRFQRVKKKRKLKTPGGKTVWHFKKKKTGFHECANCKSKLNRPRLNSTQIKKLPKTKKRPEIPYPELCSRSMR